MNDFKLDAFQVFFFVKLFAMTSLCYPHVLKPFGCGVTSSHFKPVGQVGQGRPSRLWSFLRSFSLLGGSNHPPRLAQLGCCVRRPGLLCSLLVLLLKYVSHHVWVPWLERMSALSCLMFHETSWTWDLKLLMAKKWDDRNLLTKHVLIFGNETLCPRTEFEVQLSCMSATWDYREDNQSMNMSGNGLVYT